MKNSQRERVKLEQAFCLSFVVYSFSLSLPPDVNTSLHFAIDNKYTVFFVPQIEGDDYDRLADDAYGARILVSQSSAGDRGFQGGARLTNVEFYHTGQHGFNLPWDPCMSIAFLNVDTEYVNRYEQTVSMKTQIGRKCGTLHNEDKDLLSMIVLVLVHVVDQVIIWSI